MSLLEDLLVEDDLIGDPSRLDDDDLQEINEERETEDVTHEKNDENTEENKKKVTPKKRVKNPQYRLNPDLLRGPRGLSTIESYFKDIKFKGKGHEKEDLDRVMWRLQHWCHRLYPKFQFDDCLKKIEKLGTKRVVQTYVNKIRYGLIEQENHNAASVHNENEMEVLPPEDIFEELLDHQLQLTESDQSEQITDEMKERILRNKELAKQKLMSKRLAEEQQLLEYQNSEDLLDQQSSSNLQHVSENVQPESSETTIDVTNTVVTEEQKERMERQRQLAIQKRLERLRKQEEEKLQHELSFLNNTVNNYTIDLDNTNINI